MTRRPSRPRRPGALSLLVGLAIVASLGLSPASARAQDETEDTGGNNVQGNTYVSPAFGYAISWDTTWDATDDAEATDPATSNVLTLENQISTVLVEGTAVDIAPAACVEEVAAGVEADPAATNFQQTEDNLAGDLPNATYTVDYDNGEDSVSITMYVQCQSILDGEAVLDVVHLAVTEEFEDQITEREDLLENLSLDGSLPEPEGDEPDGQDGPADDGGAPDDEAPDESEAGGSNIGQASVPGGDGDRPANEDDLVDLIDSSIVDINSYWAREFPLLSGGEAYTPPTEWITWTGSVPSGCGAADSFGEDGTPGVGPFYCPPDRTIYYDLNFANIQLQVVENDFVIPVVMAHELGHHIQELLGLETCVETPCLDSSLLTSQEIEYMADCWAGAWAQDAELRGRLGSRDVDDNIAQYSIILGGGFESADIGSHGRGAERVWWFLNGYLEGGARCLDTSAVTAGLADEDPTTPEDSRDPDETTPEAGETTTPEPDETTTPEADEPTPTTVGLEETVELAAYDFEATRLRTRDAIDTEEPDEGAFAVVYFHVEIADDGDGPFDYESWTLVDGNGTAYAVDENATNQLLSTAYEDGIEEDLEGGGGYDLAMVFDVPADAAGLTLVNADAGVTVELGA